MFLAKVVGNVVATVKDESHAGYKLMIARAIDMNGNEVSEDIICFDAADSGIGDTVLINDDGGAGQMLLDDEKCIIDNVIAGVVDHYVWNK